jgi:hypothetical protein
MRTGEFFAVDLTVFGSVDGKKECSAVGCYGQST